MLERIFVLRDDKVRIKGGKEPFEHKKKNVYSPKESTAKNQIKIYGGNKKKTYLQ